MKHPYIAASLLSLFVVLATAGNGPTTEEALRTLTADFSQARSMPLGSRPSPPSIALSSLYGVSSSAILAALGEPPESPVIPHCRTDVCMCFPDGPEPARLKGPVPNGEGTMSIDVPNGGPWELILGFRGDR